MTSGRPPGPLHDEAFSNRNDLAGGRSIGVPLVSTSESPSDGAPLLVDPNALNPYEPLTFGPWIKAVDDDGFRTRDLILDCARIWIAYKSNIRSSFRKTARTDFQHSVLQVVDLCAPYSAVEPGCVSGDGTWNYTDHAGRILARAPCRCGVSASEIGEGCTSGGQVLPSCE